MWNEIGNLFKMSLSGFTVFEKEIELYISSILVAGAVGYGIGYFQFTMRIANLKSQNDTLNVDLKSLENQRKLDRDITHNPDATTGPMASDKGQDSIRLRSFSLEELAKLKSILNEIAGNVSISQDMLSGESIQLSAQAAKVFRKCNWTVSTSVALQTDLPVKSGILITTHVGNTLSGDSEVVVRAFKNAGIEFELEKKPVKPTGTMASTQVDIYFTHT